MNKNNLQLSRAYAGNLRLTFWDSNHGRDVTWVITPREGIFVEDTEDSNGMKPVPEGDVTNQFYLLMNHIEESYKDER